VSIITLFERIGRQRAVAELRRLGYTQIAENLRKQEAD